MVTVCVCVLYGARVHMNVYCVGVYKCVCVCPMCVLSVAVSDSVSCCVRYRGLVLLCTMHVCTFLLCCFVVACVLVSVVSCESSHIIVYCV